MAWRALGLTLPSADRTLCVSGVATMSAYSVVSDIVFQRHGRRKSVQATDIYVYDDLDRRLSVSKFLGL